MAEPVAGVATMAAGPAGARRLPSTLVRSIVFRFAVYGVNVLTGIISARALSPGGRGELAAMTIWPILLSGVTTLGLPSSLIYQLRRTPERRASLVGWALVISAISGAVATILGWFVIPWWLRDQPPAIIAGAQLCLLATVAYSLTLTGRAVLEARGQLDRSQLIQSISPLVTLAALVPLAVLGTLTSRSAAAIYVLAAVPTLVWLLVAVVRSDRPAIGEGRQVLPGLLHFGARSYGVDLCAVLGLCLDQAMVVGLLPPGAVGLYAVARSLSIVISAVHGSVALVSFPKMVGLAYGDLRVAIARSARLTFLVSGAVGVVVFIFGGSLVTWLYGSSFAGAGHILPILILEAVLAGVPHVLLQGFMSAGRPGVATLIQLVSLAASVPLFLILVPAYGVNGAAFGLLAGTGLRLLLTVAAYPAFLQVPAPHLWIGRSDMAELAAYHGALRQSVARLRTGEAE